MTELTLAKLASESKLSIDMFPVKGGHQYNIKYKGSEYVSDKTHKDVISCTKALVKDLQKIEKQN